MDVHADVCTETQPLSSGSPKIVGKLYAVSLVEIGDRRARMEPRDSPSALLTVKTAHDRSSQLIALPAAVLGVPRLTSCGILEKGQGEFV